MADLKFNCPECDQRLAVDDTAAGMKIDCPSCRSALAIPAVSGEPAKVLTRRRLATADVNSSSAYEELERKQSELSAALEEAANLRGESERSKSELAKLREDFAAAVAHRSAPPAVTPPPADERLRGENDQLRAKLAAAESARELLAGRVAELEAAPAPVAPVIPAEISDEASGLRKDLEEVRRNFTEVQGQLEAANVERERLKAEAGQAATSLKNLGAMKAELDEAQARLTQITKGAEEQQRELAAMREQLGRLPVQESELADVRSLLHQREDELEQLRLQANSLTTERDAALARIATQEQEAASDLMLNQAAAQQQADDFRTKLNTANEDLQARSAEVTEARQALRDREDSLRAASLTMEAAKNELDRLKQDAEAAAHEHTQLRGQFDETLEEAKELQHRVDSLLDDLHAREREVSDTRENLMRTTAERDAAQQKLTEKEEELREFAARLEATHRYAESKLLETQQDAEAKVEAAQRDADLRTSNAQRAMEEALAAKQETEGRFAATEALVSEGATRFETLRQSSDAERATALKESEEFRQRIDQLINDLTTRENELGEARRKIEGNAVAQEGMERLLVAKGEELTRITAELDTARREAVESLALSREETSTAHQEAAAKLENLGRVYEAKANALREEGAQAARALTEELEQLKRELSESNKHADAMESRVSALQADQQRSLRSIEEMRTELETARQAHRKASDETVEKEKQIAELFVQIAAAQEAEKGVRTRAGDAEKEFRAKIESSEHAVEEARRAASDRDRVAEELARAKADLTAFQETIREARQERDAVKLTVDSLELQIEENLDLFHAAEAERDALKAELEAVRAGLERAKQHVNVLQSRRDQMREEIARLKLQLGQSPDSAL